jgi:hypothetical protein
VTGDYKQGQTTGRISAGRRGDVLRTSFCPVFMPPMILGQVELGHQWVLPKVLSDTLGTRSSTADSLSNGRRGSYFYQFVAIYLHNFCGTRVCKRARGYLPQARSRQDR